MNQFKSFVGIDWGTTNLRVFRYGADGSVLETRESPMGTAAIRGRAFESVLLEVAGDWIVRGETTVVMCGMVGSREGWIQAPYMSCPADLQSLADNLIRVPTDVARAWIVPGLVTEAASAHLDVMRGEETQILGMQQPARNGLVVAPGTHSKWVQVEEGRIVAIRTYMTGELYSLLRSQSLLGRMMKGDEHDAAAFAKGIRRTLDDGDLAGELFSVRTEGLFAQSQPEALAAYLSGILVGAEICSALRSLQHAITVAYTMPVTVIGASKLAKLYLQALHLAGVSEIHSVDARDASSRGLWSIAMHAKQLAGAA